MTARKPCQLNSWTTSNPTLPRLTSLYGGFPALSLGGMSPSAQPTLSQYPSRTMHLAPLVSPSWEHLSTSRHVASTHVYSGSTKMSSLCAPNASSGGIMPASATLIILFAASVGATTPYAAIRSTAQLAAKVTATSALPSAPIVAVVMPPLTSPAPFGSPASTGMPFTTSQRKEGMNSLLPKLTTPHAHPRTDQGPTLWKGH